MTIESNQTRFNHETWIGQLYKFMHTARQFFYELFNGLTILLKKGLLSLGISRKTLARVVIPIF